MQRSISLNDRLHFSSRRLVGWENEAEQEMQCNIPLSRGVEAGSLVGCESCPAWLDAQVDLDVSAKSRMPCQLKVPAAPVEP